MHPKVQFVPVKHASAGWSNWSRLLLALPGLVLVAAAGALVVRPEPISVALRHSDAVWTAGRFGEVRQLQLALTAADPPPRVWVRLAQVHLLRGECAPALRFAAQALGGASRQLRRDEAALAHLVAGQCAAKNHDRRYAEAEWAAVDPRSPWRSVADVLRGEAALAAGETTTAATQYAAALRGVLPEPLHATAHFRSALVLAADQPDAARMHLRAIPDTLSPPNADLRPFMPMAAMDVAAHARQLEAILASESAIRDQLLGQQLLALSLPRLAVARFEQVPETAPRVVAARAYAAFARWQLGQVDAATDQLRELAEYAPQEPIVATLYATLAREQGALDIADAVLSTAEAHHPRDPAIMIVRSDILADRREYAQAIQERRRALEFAPPEQRPRYTQALAELHLSLTFELCDAGIAAAMHATSAAPADAAAWQLQAAILYHCRDYSGATAAAQRGLQLVPDHAALEYFLGAAEWQRGQRQVGETHLRRAADLAPASEWRLRAEELLGQ